MIRVTLDTNEYISAFNFRGQALQLIHLAIADDVEIAISMPILDETVRVLRKKFSWPPHDLHDLRRRLLKTCRVVIPRITVAVLGDAPDNRILECAHEAKSEYIITEDRAMLKVKEYAGAKLVRAADFLKILRGP